MILVRYGELALKGSNRPDFEKRLVKNIRDCLKKGNADFSRILRKRGRIFIETRQESRELSHVFGIVSFSYAVKTGTDIPGIEKVISGLLAKKRFTRFRVSAHRADKSAAMDSQEMNIVLGQFIADSFKKKVSLKDFDVDVGVEILEGNAYVFIESIDGPKGLPCGANGIAFALLNDKKSILAAWLMMRRGLRIIPVGAKPLDLSILERYNYGSRKLELTRIKEISEIWTMAEKRDIFSLITGDTMQSTNDYGEGMLILRPLVGFSDMEIRERLKNI